MKIAVGIATVLGLLGTAAGLLIPFIGELADASAPLGVPAETWVYFSAACAVTTIVGRMAQAVAAIFHPPAQELDPYAAGWRDAMNQSNVPQSPEELI